MYRILKFLHMTEFFSTGLARRPATNRMYDNKRLKSRGFLAELRGQVFAKDLKLYLNVSQQIRAKLKFLMRLVCELGVNDMAFFKNIARGTTDPGYSVSNLNKFSD